MIIVVVTRNNVYTTGVNKMNIEFCEKCKNRKIDHIIYNHLYVEDNRYVGWVKFFHQQEEGEYVRETCVIDIIINDKEEFQKMLNNVDEITSGISSLTLFRKDEIKKAMNLFEVCNQCGKSDCAYQLEHTLHDWNNTNKDE